MQDNSTSENALLKAEITQFQKQLETHINEIQRLVLAILTEDSNVFHNVNVTTIFIRLTNSLLRGYVYTDIRNTCESHSEFNEVRNMIKHELRTSIEGLLNIAKDAKSFLEKNRDFSEEVKDYFEQLSKVCGNLREYLYQ